MSDSTQTGVPAELVIAGLKQIIANQACRIAILTAQIQTMQQQTGGDEHE